MTCGMLVARPVLGLGPPGPARCAVKNRSRRFFAETMAKPVVPIYTICLAVSQELFPGEMR